MKKRKRKRKWVRIVKRETPKGIYRRLLIGGKVILGKNEHEFKGKMTKHYHIGEKFIKIVTKPKGLRGIWKYNRKRREYVRVGRKKRDRKKNKENK